MKTETPPQDSSNPPSDGYTKASYREMLMGTTLPISKNEEEHEEDWDGDRQSD